MFEKFGRRGLAALAAACLLLLAGCGSTVPLSERSSGSAGGATASTLGSATSGAITGAGGSSSAGESRGSGGTGATGTGGSSFGGNGAALSGTGAPGLGAAAAGSDGVPSYQVGDGPGVSATTITIGEEYSSQAAAADDALGAAGMSQGDAVTQFDAIARYINAHGGIAHRQVRLDFYNADLTQSNTQTDQDACTDFTQDTKTFVLLSGTPTRDRCAAQAGAISMDEAFIAETTPTLAQYPSDLNLDGFTIDRSMQITVQGLAHEGYFATGAKIGIVTWDESDYQYALTAAALPALARLGIHNPKEALVAVPDSEGDLAATSASVSSAVLKFHSAGIDHVILFDGPAGINSSGDLVLEWMQQSNSQDYYPKYGLNSTSGFSTLASDYPTKEMVGSEGVAWVPVTDLTQSDYEALPQSPLQKTCIQVMTAAGQAPASAEMEGLELDACDQMFFLQQAFAGLTGGLDQQTALAAIDRLGSSFPDLTTFGTYFSASQHDGAELVRNIAFVPSCSCYRYDSPAYNPAA